VIAMVTDYIFMDEAAIGRSIALCTLLLCPTGAFILWRSMPAIQKQLTEQG